MASSTDFKLLFEKYQEDGIKQGKPPIQRTALCPPLTTFAPNSKKLEHGDKRIL